MVRASRAAFVVGVLAALVPARAAADEPPPSAERIRSAAEEYDRGRRFYDAGDFEQAAVHFENAYSDAPRAEPLRNAIRSRRAAKQLARAATLASLAATKYADDAKTMALVNETLAEAAPKLHVATIRCAPACSVAADGRVVSLADATDVKVHFDPGAHTVVVSWPGDRSRQAKVDATAGGKSALSFDAPPPRKATPGDLTGGKGGVPPSTKPFGPVVFFVGAGLTVAGGVATVVSGVDAKNNPGVDAVRRDCVGQGENCPTYQEGKSAETRTNILLGVTGGLALVTAVVGVFFTQWETPAKSGGGGPGVAPTAGVGPGGGTVGLSGRF